jgi:prepilin-type processing-associated H-X9-DG protein/prepilin-type N-terminal cleavage/methylation domain-containing protein
MPRRRAIVTWGFTLVELLVVIGIIALLIAILLPALSRAREQANMIKCMATLRSMAQAAHAHAAEHQGYMPIAGRFSGRASPEGLGDVNRMRYTYVNNGSLFNALPLTPALGRYMNVPLTYSGIFDVADGLKSEELQRHFICPSHTNRKPGWTLSDGNGWARGGYDEYSSYIFNACVLSVTRVAGGGMYPGGKVTAVQQPSEVFLFADGNNTGLGEAGFAIYPDANSSQGTLFEYWRAYGSSKSFDFTRHRNRINVVFVDGHAQTMNMPDPAGEFSDQIRQTGNRGDFEQIGVSRGVSLR